MNGQLYANDSSRNTSYLQLASNGAFVAVDDLLFVDFGASIKRENVSAFSSGTLGDEFNSTNQSLVRRFFLAPDLHSVSERTSTVVSVTVRNGPVVAAACSITATSARLP